MIETSQLKVRYITDEKGNKKEIILSLQDFEELMEDYADLAFVAERKNEDTIPHNTVLEELKKDGLL
jgi:hypothetical protein